jgi:DNA polymerase-3 subunit beta
MEARCGSEFLKQAITAVQNVTEVRISNPVVENILLRATQGKIHVFATDLSLDVQFSVDGEVKEDGQAGVPARLAQGIVRELYDPEVLIRQEKGTVWFRCGRNEFHVQAVDTEEFPVFAPVEEGVVFEVEAGTLRDVLRKTVFATTSEQGAFQLDGVRMSDQEEGLEFVATDGRRLSRMTVPGVRAEGIVALIPSKAMQELGRLLPESGSVAVQVGGKRVMFSGERFRLVTRLLEDEFPPYQHIIPGEFSFSVHVEREAFTQCVRAAAVMSQGTVQMVCVRLREGVMEVRSEEGEVGGARGEIPVEYSGEDFQVGFRGSFLLDFLRCGEGESIQLDIVDAARASVFRSVGEEQFLHLIMPMRLEEKAKEERTASSEG